MIFYGTLISHANTETKIRHVTKHLAMLDHNCSLRKGNNSFYGLVVQLPIWHVTLCSCALLEVFGSPQY